MTTKKDAKQTQRDDVSKTRKKLTLSKETIRDLTSKGGKAEAVRGGARKCSGLGSGCI